VGELAARWAGVALSAVFAVATVDATVVVTTVPDDVTIVVDVVADPDRQRELSPNYVAFTAFVTDAATGEPIAEEYAVQASVRSGDVVDDTVFHLGYPHRDDPSAEPGRYPGVVIVPSGGRWTVSVSVFDRFAAETETIPETLAHDELTVDVDAPALPLAAQPDTDAQVNADASELVVRILHAFAGLTWVGLALLLALAGLSKPILLSGEVGGLIERNLGRLSVALVWVTGVVWLTGLWNLRTGTAFAPPLTPRQAEQLFSVPYARPYVYALYLKIAVYAALTLLAIPIVRRARRAVARAEPRGAGVSLPFAVSVGGAIVLICVAVLTYVHRLSEALRVAG
jgi:hypothetical protein